ncbi:MAG: hypothetical protein V1934_02950 [Methanobacteriota archaeon]
MNPKPDRVCPRLKAAGPATLLSACLLFSLAALSAQPAASSEPALSANPDGTTTAEWNFAGSTGFALTNATVGPEGAELSFRSLSWTLDSAADFQGGNFTRTEGNASGDVRLGLTNPVELLKNGNFSAPTLGITADYWRYDSYSPQDGSCIANSQARVMQYGYLDDGTCWNNSFQDFLATEGGTTWIWLNQTFSLPSLPYSVETSAMHEFVNTDAPFSPGAVAHVDVFNNRTNASVSLNDTGTLTASRPYARLGGILDSTFFNEAGQYNLSLATVTDSTGDVTYNTASASIFHLWDNASVKYRAYHPTGRYVSEVFDSGSLSFWNSASWLEGEPFGSNVTVRVRSGNSNNTYDNSWSPWSNELADPSGSGLFLQPTRYFQFMADLDTSYTNRTPTLDSFTASYEKYHENGSVETGDFTPSSVTDWGIFTHSEDLNGQAVLYEFSMDGGAIWTPVPANGDMRGTVPAASGARIRFRAVLHSGDSSVSPEVEWLRLVFVGADPVLTLDCGWSDARPIPGEPVRLQVFINNTAWQNSSFAWLNISLPTACVDYASWGSDSVGLRVVSQQVNASMATARFAFADVAPGRYHMWIDAVVKAGVENGTVHASGASLAYTDPLDVSVSSVPASSSIIPRAPVVGLWAECLDDALDIGGVARYVVHIENRGEGPASKVWLNCTLDGSLSYADSTQGSANGGRVLWNLGQVEPLANVSVSCNATLFEGVSHGELLETEFSVDYADTAGHVRSAASGQPRVVAALASGMAFSFVGAATVVHPGDNFVATAYYNNTGYGTASAVNISLNVPDSLAINGSNQVFQRSGRMAYWNFSDVGPGPHSFAVTFTARDTGRGASSASVHAEMSVVDQVGGYMGTVGQGDIELSIESVPTIWEKIYWPWSGVGAVAAIASLALGLWWLYKPTPPGITDVFFIYRDGRLISHRSAASSMRRDLDEDLVSSMLTAVQQFVSDSLSEKDTDHVKKLEFGEKEILIERGKRTYLAVIYTGDMNGKLNARIRELVEKIELDYPSLEKWNGSSRDLEPIGAMLDRLIGEWQSSDETCSLH